MRIIIFLLLLISSAALATLEFTNIARLQNLSLINTLEKHLVEEYRSKTAKDFNQSLDSGSFGQILDRAADMVTTRVTLIATRKSQGINLNNGPVTVIIQARYLVENSSEEPLEKEQYLVFKSDNQQEWTYAGSATLEDFYLNFVRVY
ncbi:MAG: hypothetical protein P8Y20_00690 [Gammaproteobacteria bacterium]|jgi:hypothetical protein